MLNMIAAGVGGLVSGFNAFQQAKQQKEMLRMEEDYNRKAAAGLYRAAEQNANLNPQAAAQAQMAQVNATQAAATGAALNAAAGQTASSGDFGNAQGAGVTMSQAAQAAAAPYAQQQAQILQQSQAEQANKISQAESINNSIANLSQHVNYIERTKNDINPWGKALQTGLSGILGGANLGESLGQLVGGSDKEVGKPAAPAAPAPFVGPPTAQQAGYQAPQYGPMTAEQAGYQAPAPAQQGLGAGPSMFTGGQYGMAYNMGQTLLNALPQNVRNYQKPIY